MKVNITAIQETDGQMEVTLTIHPPVDTTNWYSSDDAKLAYASYRSALQAFWNIHLGEAALTQQPWGE